MARIEAYGIGADLPRGWDGEIAIRAHDRPGLRSMEPDRAMPLVHLANFALPVDRGDFGGGAVERMGPGGIFITLFEYEPESAGQALFRAEGIPTLQPDDFHPDQMQHPLPGQAGVQRFFTVNGRPFCLYVALGSHRNRRVLAREVDRVVASLTID